MHAGTSDRHARRTWRETQAGDARGPTILRGTRIPQAHNARRTQREKSTTEAETAETNGSGHRNDQTATRRDEQRGEEMQTTTIRRRMTTLTPPKSLFGGTVAVIRFRSQLAALLLTPYSLHKRSRTQHVRDPAPGHTAKKASRVASHRWPPSRCARR